MQAPLRSALRLAASLLLCRVPRAPARPLALSGRLTSSGFRRAWWARSIVETSTLTVSGHPAITVYVEDSENLYIAAKPLHNCPFSVTEVARKTQTVAGPTVER